MHEYQNSFFSDLLVHLLPVHLLFLLFPLTLFNEGNRSIIPLLATH